MKMKVKLLYLCISLLMLLLSSFSCVAQPAQENKPATSHPNIITIVETVIIMEYTATPETPHPESTRPSIDAKGDTVELQLNINKMPNVTLRLDQKLVIMPDWQRGQEDWWVYISNPEILSLEPSIDPTKPPETGWVWIPHKLGSVEVIIIEPKLTCHKEPPFCEAPSQTVRFRVKVVPVP